jgi:hypothetical protein
MDAASAWRVARRFPSVRTALSDVLIKHAS